MSGILELFLSQVKLATTPFSIKAYCMYTNSITDNNMFLQLEIHSFTVDSCQTIGPLTFALLPTVNPTHPLMSEDHSFFNNLSCLLLDDSTPTLLYRLTVSSRLATYCHSFPLVVQICTAVSGMASVCLASKYFTSLSTDASYEGKCKSMQRHTV